MLTFCNKMFIFGTAVACLLLIPQDTIAQTTSNVQFPQLISVQPVPNSDTALSYSFTIPTLSQDDHIDANYTLYDFVDANKANPQPYPSQMSNCSVTDPCFTSTVPQVALNPGTFVIGCFQWTLWGASNANLGTSYDCILGRTTMNLVQLPALSWTIDPPIASNNNACIVAYYPAALPYDVINITSTLNGTIVPTAANATSNDTYSVMRMFTFDKLSSNTYYNACTILNYANSVIRGSGKIETICQSVNTLADSATLPTSTTIPTTTTTMPTSTTTMPTSTTTMPTSTTTMPTTATITATTTTTTVPYSSTTMLLSNFSLLIFFFLLVVL